jgi:hypothetical protein
MLRKGSRNAIIGGFRSWERTQSDQERDFLLLKKRGKQEGQALSLFPFFYITINQYPIFIYEIPKQVNI